MTGDATQIQLGTYIERVEDVKVTQGVVDVRDLIVGKGEDLEVDLFVPEALRVVVVGVAIDGQVHRGPA